MNFIKKSAVTFVMLISMAASSTVAFAESSVSVNDTISHIEKALVNIKNSDFAAANLHLKAARSSSTQIESKDAIVKKANSNLIQGQIQSKKGKIEASTTLLNKAIEQYKSL